MLEHIGGRPLVILPQVFNPALFEASTFLARTLNSITLAPDTSVLDLGTGSGLNAIMAAQRSRCVTATDINPEAVRCARINVLLNHVEERVEVFEGDLFAPLIDRRFDVIVFNPPFFRGVPRDRLDQAWRSTDVIERFAAEVREHLAPQGYSLVIYSSTADEAALRRAFEANDLHYSIFAQRDVLNEVLTIYRVTV
ncbi:MAG: methyltransferase [Thermoflexales bacterium]|nr:methyltransferase [Thermoflexales bacterium]